MSLTPVTMTISCPNCTGTGAIYQMLPLEDGRMLYDLYCPDCGHHSRFIKPIYRNRTPSRVAV